MRRISPMAAEPLAVVRAAGRTVAADVRALADSPSVDASLKDGYAVISKDVVSASMEHPVKLLVSGHVPAGGATDQRLGRGETIRVLTGAPLPPGADAVLTEELAVQAENFVYARADAGPGINVLKKGNDVSKGQRLARPGQRLTARHIGLLIAGGVEKVSVFKRPKIGLLATGSEIILPGAPITVPMTPGKIYASNVGMQQAWLENTGHEVRVLAAMDDEDQIAGALNVLGSDCDMIITSGGVWKGEKDLTAAAVTSLGGEMVFHRLRLGPGKATGMAMLNHRPVFCLPGGPSSNFFGFIMMVLPALSKMSGCLDSPHLMLHGKLEKAVYGQKDWTNLVLCDIEKNPAGILLWPPKPKSRLWALATQQAIVVVPEGVEKMDAGDMVPFIFLY